MIPVVENIFHRKKVLIIDDDVMIRQSIRRLLSWGHQYDIDEAQNAREAEVKLTRFNPDLILLDVGLPDKKGYELCMNLRSDPGKKKLKIIGLSGYAGGIGNSVMLACGADYFFEKPFDAEKFVRKIEDLLSGF